MRTTVHLPAVILLATLATPEPEATAQTPSQLVPVDQRIEDVSPLGLSLRQMQPTLRQPNNFQELYRFRGDDENLVRAQGGLYLVFQRSIYGADKKGKVYPLVPPNTVFYIGPPPGWMISSAVTAVASSEMADAARIDDRLDLRITPGLVIDTAGGEPVRHHAVASDTRPTPMPGNRIVLDAEYRVDRLRTLMQEAATARSTPPVVLRRHHRSTPGIPVTGQASPSDGSRHPGP
jgi:hypothetical protein